MTKFERVKQAYISTLKSSDFEYYVHKLKMPIYCIKLFKYVIELDERNKVVLLRKISDVAFLLHLYNENFSREITDTMSDNIWNNFKNNFNISDVKEEIIFNALSGFADELEISLQKYLKNDLNK